MNKKVIVNIRSKQLIDGKEDSIELITTGNFYKKEDAYFVVYQETEISGMQGTTTTVKIYSEEVCLIRFGTTNTRLNFKKGIKDVSLYKTLYGVIELSIEPSIVDINVTEEGGEINLSYILEVGGGETTQNELYIKIQESL